jgi:hypothetical protein
VPVLVLALVLMQVMLLEPMLELEQVQAPLPVSAPMLELMEPVLLPLLEPASVLKPLSVPELPEPVLVQVQVPVLVPVLEWSPALGEPVLVLVLMPLHSIGHLHTAIHWMGIHLPLW